MALVLLAVGTGYNWNSLVHPQVTRVLTEAKGYYHLFTRTAHHYSNAILHLMGLIPFQGIITWSAYLLNSILWFGLGIASVKGRSYLYHYYPEVAMEAMAPPSRTWRRNQAFHNMREAKSKRGKTCRRYRSDDGKSFWRRDLTTYRVHRNDYGDSKGPWRKEPGKPAYRILCNHHRPSQHYTPPTK